MLVIDSDRATVFILRASLAALCAALVACGGGGGAPTSQAPSPTSPPAPAPSPSPTPSPVPFNNGPQLEATAVISRLDVAPVTPIPAASLPPPTYNQRYLPSARHVAWADFNGDGLNDIIICPAFFSSRPLLPCEFWLNRGGGRFEIATSEVVAGTLGLPGGVNSILIADFNGDGRPDVFLATQGIEDPDRNLPDSFAAHNRVLLSQPDGKLRDTTDTSLASDTMGFHHPSAMGDIDGDGSIDIAVCELGGTGGSKPMAEGVYLLMNDGRGNFTRTLAGLPQEVASNDFSKPLPYDFFGCGSVQLADLDGDGRLDLVVSNYIHGSATNHVHGTRLYQQQPDHSFVLKASLPLPATMDAIVNPADGTQLGASGIAAGDLDGDGRPEIVLIFENIGVSGTYIEVLHNDGNFAFSDATLATLGSYDLTMRQSGYSTQAIGIAAVKLTDLNGDGKLDLVLSQGGFFHNTLASTSPFWLNDGKGKLSPWLPLIGGKRYMGLTLPDPEWMALLKIPYTNNTDLLAFDATGDGLVDWVFLDAITDPKVETVPPINGMYTEKVLFVRVVPAVK